MGLDAFHSIPVVNTFTGRERKGKVKVLGSAWIYREPFGFPLARWEDDDCDLVKVTVSLGWIPRVFRFSFSL